VPVLLALAGGLATLVGGAVAVRPGDRLHLVLGLSAGLLLGLVSFELLPEVFELAGRDRVGGVPAVMLAFVAGFLLLHAIERAIAVHPAHEEEYDQHAHAHPTTGWLGGLFLCVHSLLDGAAIGLGFQNSPELGASVAVAVLAHRLADGINTVTVMLLAGHSRRRAVGLLLAVAAAPVLGTAGSLLITPSDRLTGLYLAYFAGFLLYLATADILPEAHARHPSGLTLASTVGGLGLIWLAAGLT
jgi:ZIP family zinc transporter